MKKPTKPNAAKPSPLPQWDVETYEKMSQPYADDEAAKLAVDTFMAKLRIEHRIAEVLVVAAAHSTNEGAASSVMATLGLGDSNVTAQLAATAYRRFALPQIEIAERLRKLATTPEDKSGV